MNLENLENDFVLLEFVTIYVRTYKCMYSMLFIYDWAEALKQGPN